MLRASHHLLRPGGRTAFFTIHPTPGLDAGQRRRAHRDGPVAVASHLPNGELLARAGFVDIEETDCTAEFGTVARSLIDQCDRHHDALAEMLGADEVDQRQRDRRAQLRAVEEGLLQRSLLVATRPTLSAEVPDRSETVSGVDESHTRRPDRKHPSPPLGVQ